MLTFAPDDESQKRLVACHRVFFESNFEQKVELRTVSYPDSALPLARARTQKILNLPNCPYTKKSC
jgi:hypothetical protein